MYPSLRVKKGFIRKLRWAVFHQVSKVKFGQHRQLKHASQGQLR